MPAVPVAIVPLTLAQRLRQWVVRVVRVGPMERAAQAVLAAQVLLHIQAETVRPARAVIAAVAAEEPEMQLTVGLPRA